MGSISIYLNPLAPAYNFYMKLLDLFCGAGGAGMGYHKAGFEVTGVDIEPQPRYPFGFVQGDAFQYLLDHGHEYDAIHASPPCQAHSSLKTMWNYRNHESFIEPTRDLLRTIGKPWVIENVVGAPLINPITLCGTMFGLQTPDGAQLKRHRLFETSFDIRIVPQCSHTGLRTIGIYGDKARDPALEKRHYSKPKETRGRPAQIQFSLGAARAAMGMEWASMKELSQAIPPAYTEFVGRELQSILFYNRYYEETYMTNGINKVTLVGRLGKDPEVRYMPDGKAVANLTLATTESWKDKTTGAKVENTEWHRVVFFGKTAEIAKEYLKKGALIYVEGKNKTEKWKDKQGVERTTTKVVCHDMQMLGGRSMEAGHAETPAQQGPVDFDDDINF